MHGVRSSDLTQKQKQAALQYLMFLKQKYWGKVKGHGCADGWKQRVYKTKEDASSSTISVEALFLTCLIDAMEGQSVATCDVPGAFLQADIDEQIHVHLDGELAELLVKVDPTYKQFIAYECNKPVIYTELDKALYGMLQAALLFWQKLRSFLIDTLGFQVNPYDHCVVNKDIDGSQCTIGWHVDDIKISHKNQQVVNKILEAMNAEYDKETPLTITCGPMHEYLGMEIDFSQAGEVKFLMPQYIDRLVAEIPADLSSGMATMPAVNHLFQVNHEAEKLSEVQAEHYHHLVVKLLYLCKCTHPDLQTVVAFLTTRVQGPDVDDWKKLGRYL